MEKVTLKWGATYGIAEGLQGQTYALPTMDKNIRRLSLDKVKIYVNRFLPIVKANPQLHFLITDVGCGLAADALPNVSLPAAFLHFI